MPWCVQAKAGVATVIPPASANAAAPPNVSVLVTIENLLCLRKRPGEAYAPSGLNGNGPSREEFQQLLRCGKP
jgi:hypothetical protein